MVINRSQVLVQFSSNEMKLDQFRQLQLQTASVDPKSLATSKQRFQKTVGS